MNKRNSTLRLAAALGASVLLAGIPMQLYAHAEANPADPAAAADPAAPADPNTPEAAPAAPDAAGVPSDQTEQAETAVTEETTEETTESETTTETTTTEPAETTLPVTDPPPDTLSMIEYEDAADGGIRINYFRWTSEETVTIPDMIDGKPVTDIAERAFKYCYADTVVLPATVKHIGDSAFEGCAYLRAAVIPDQCETIGASAFANCKRLEYVTIPASVRDIGNLAFDGTPFYENQQDDFVILGDGILYTYNGSESELTIPENVKIIGACSCSGHAVMKSVTIPASVQSIRDFAFDGCTALAEIHTPDYIADISATAFENTKWITAGKDEFLTLGKMLIRYRGEENVVDVPDGIRVIGESAFEGNAAVTTVHLPQTVEEIRRTAFAHCPSLQVAEFGDNLKSIGDSAFESCDTLNYLRLGHALQSVGDYAFASCPALTEIYLPDTLEKIGEKAFGYAHDDTKGYLKLKNELVLYSNTESARLYAEAEKITREPLPDTENTEPAPDVTAPVGSKTAVGKVRGKGWIAAAGIGGVLVLAGGIWYAFRKRRESY
ncbi:MAG: leucine-rich repeat domain-containing protein [Oscillospiraceae bacterium]|nr:leucine-rich repeat domain-containing protein [Oscillospiraceae bacterium]